MTWGSQKKSSQNKKTNWTTFSVLWGKGKERKRPFPQISYCFLRQWNVSTAFKLKWCEILRQQLWAQEEWRTRQWAGVRGEPQRAGHPKDVSSCMGGEGRAGRWSVTALPSPSSVSLGHLFQLVSCLSLHTCCFSHPNAFPSLHQESSSFKSQSNGLFSKSSLVAQPGLNLCVLCSHETSDAPHSSIPLITSSSNLVLFWLRWWTSHKGRDWPHSCKSPLPSTVPAVGSELKTSAWVHSVLDTVLVIKGEAGRGGISKRKYEVTWEHSTWKRGQVTKGGKQWVRHLGQGIKMEQRWEVDKVKQTGKEGFGSQGPALPPKIQSGLPFLQGIKPNHEPHPLLLAWGENSGEPGYVKGWRGLVLPLPIIPFVTVNEAGILVWEH